MSGPKISLCCITGNEEMHIMRFLDSFKDAFDELCLVRATGNAQPDKTMELAEQWCRSNGREFFGTVYANAGLMSQLGQTVEDEPVHWPHVDDFAAARNKAWGAATGDWQFWADIDDLLNPGSAEKIRAHAAEGKHDAFFFRYAIRTSNEQVMRERLFRRGIASWELPIHERCSKYAPKPGGGEWDVWADESVVFVHQPDSAKPRDPNRNRRIMEHAMRYQNEFPWYLAGEYYIRWCWAKEHGDKPAMAEAREKLIYWYEIANKAHTLPEQKITMLGNLSTVYAEDDPERALDLVWDMIRIAFWRKEGWAGLAEYELRLGRGDRAEVATELMMAFKKPGATTIPATQRLSGWEGLTLRTRALRANHHEEKARELERSVFHNPKWGPRISLLHATRGRPAQALETRANFLKSAALPLAVEHIFAIDADDAESRERLAHYRHVIVDPPKGCVAAWNAAARESEGEVLVQLSDDWLPCIEWDLLIWGALEEAAEKRGRLMKNLPLVLAISDGHRTDDLLCMAILTRTRYHDQRENGEPPYIFHPDYFGVFSDNEFSMRAYKDGVVVQARHIQFIHRHPIFDGKPFDQWDETHRRQNAPERYAEGAATFNRRNPQHVVTLP